MEPSVEPLIKDENDNNDDAYKNECDKQENSEQESQQNENNNDIDDNNDADVDEQNKQPPRIKGWKKFFLIFGIVVVVLGATVGVLFASHVLCVHKWSEPTCTQPQICSICKREKGKPLGHDWNEATCTEPQICKVCGESQGEALGHKWSAATCLEPAICSVCGETNGEALGHSWIEATCQNPKTCAVCGETEGEALPHEWKDATCTEPKTCKNCNATTGKANGHKWKDATCTEPKTCEVCGEKKGESNGHSWIPATIAYPKTCEVCGKTSGSSLDYAYMGEAIVGGDSDSSLVLRETKSDSGKKLATIPSNTKIDIWDCGEYDWYYTAYDGKYGYIKTQGEPTFVNKSTSSGTYETFYEGMRTCIYSDSDFEVYVTGMSEYHQLILEVNNYSDEKIEMWLGTRFGNDSILDSVLCEDVIFSPGTHKDFEASLNPVSTIDPDGRGTFNPKGASTMILSIDKYVKKEGSSYYHQVGSQDTTFYLDQP